MIERFLRQIDSLKEVLLSRLLPTFDSISKEADEAAETAWRDLMNTPAGDSVDIDYFYEEALSTGLERYGLLEEMQQSIINLSTIAIYHLFEQQCVFLTRRETLPFGQWDTPSEIHMGDFMAWMRSKGIDFESTQAWQDLQELKDVANVIKHAEGRSCESLRKRRPEFFVHPDCRDEMEHSSPSQRTVNQPLAGEELYVTIGDLRRYFDALKQFWRAVKAIVEPSVEE